MILFFTLCYLMNQVLLVNKTQTSFQSILGKTMVVSMKAE